MTQEKFTAFVNWCNRYITGHEKQDAQAFIQRLMMAFGYEGALESGGKFESPVMSDQSKRFVDFYIPRKVLIEMKSRGTDLRRHYLQALNYWIDLAAQRPQYIVLCNFDEFWVYDLDKQPREPMQIIQLNDLPKQWLALAFLAAVPTRPSFDNNRVEVTAEAANSLSAVFRSLVKRKTDGVELEQAQRLVLQSLFALFAEGIRLLPKSDTFSGIIKDSLKDETEALASYDLLTLLFLAMNSQRGTRYGRFANVAYFDGGLFAEINPVELSKPELELLENATRHDWSKINPGIFGTLFEQSVESGERHQSGMHYTSEVDILRIVHPVIVRPWANRIHTAKTPDELVTLHTELCHYRVLDPACGSGNFLYVAYREMKRLEREIFDRLREFGMPELPQARVKTTQFYGIDINPFAVELAKVTLMIAKKLALDEVGIDEPALPLDNLDANFKAADALFTDWYEFDACIGNPPYIAGGDLRRELGEAQTEQLRRAFGVAGRADYCAYWFRKAHDLMSAGKRAGLVATNSIRQNESRIPSLDYIVNHQGMIYEAVSSMPWSGTANVHVSVVCWAKTTPPFTPSRLWLHEPKAKDDQAFKVVELMSINPALSPLTDVTQARVLQVNTIPRRAFEGQKPGNTKEFTLTITEAAEMIRRDPHNREVIFPFLVGDDLNGNSEGKPRRFIIDFRERDSLDARTYKQPFQRIETLVLPKRQAKVTHKPHTTVDDSRHLARWWLHERPRPELHEALTGLHRCIVMSRHATYYLMDFADTRICFGDALKIFAFDDDYTFGILHSALHELWVKQKGSSLKSDARNTTTSTYDTFPFPQHASHENVKRVAQAARSIHEFRRDRMRKNSRLTLREFYKDLREQKNSELGKLHEALDTAVYTVYGFEQTDDVLQRLLALNLEVAGKIERGEPVTAPGIPVDYPNPAELVSAGCILPPELL